MDGPTDTTKSIIFLLHSATKWMISVSKLDFNFRIKMHVSIKFQNILTILKVAMPTADLGCNDYVCFFTQYQEKLEDGKLVTYIQLYKLMNAWLLGVDH